MLLSKISLEGLALKLQSVIFNQKVSENWNAPAAADRQKMSEKAVGKIAHAGALVEKPQQQQRSFEDDEALFHGKIAAMMQLDSIFFRSI